MNLQQKLIVELSRELYQRAADSSKKLSKATQTLAKYHANRGYVKGEYGDPEEKGNPNIRLHKKLMGLAKDRELQSQKFTAASKGVKSRRPARGYNLGNYQKNLSKQSEIERSRSDEGASTGSDPEFTGERVGRFIARTGKGSRRSVDIAQRLKKRHGELGYHQYIKGISTGARGENTKYRMRRDKTVKGPNPLRSDEGKGGLKRLGRVLKAQRRDQRSVADAGGAEAQKDYDKVIGTLNRIKRKHQDAGHRLANPDQGRKIQQGIAGGKAEIRAPHKSTSRSISRAVDRSVGADPKPEDRPRKVLAAEIERVFEPAIDRKISKDVAKYRLRRKMRKEGGRN